MKQSNEQKLNDIEKYIVAALVKCDAVLGNGEIAHAKMLLERVIADLQCVLEDKR